ncbi:hypothetical protein [Streptomyces sp. H27-C3]|uniref:hypothetical protein n=1 Tax=Streptomyces sp. H27-C3 TaxID=3046305 RepID=UPI0024B950ED|nr:hypothetical protein [Streptomyces sp. H27-C3]MDJ0463104.1 hypothetical protein [Streptomyces sp. H27-C3]
MVIIERLDLCVSYREATDSLHEYAQIATRLGQAPRYGVRIGKRVYVKGRLRWPVYLVDDQAEPEPKRTLKSVC